MIIDFPLILLALTVFTGVVSLVDWLVCRNRKKKGVDTSIEKKPLIIDYARSLFPVFLIVFLLRSFLVQPYRVPTGSLEPTVIPGDFILVNQFDYGLHFPVWNKQFIKVSHPKTGQIAMFYWRVDHHFANVVQALTCFGNAPHMDIPRSVTEENITGFLTGYHSRHCAVNITRMT